MALRGCRLPALGAARDAPELVLVHGWGLASTVWEEWLGLLRQHCHVTLIDLPGYGDNAELSIGSMDELLAAIVAAAPAQAVYLGYSLGGMLAAGIARQYPQRVQGLITLASNVRFVADQHWPHAMDAATFQQFMASVEHNPERALSRFAALQSGGAEQPKALLKLLRDKLGAEAPPGLLTSLHWLATLDHREWLASRSVPTRLLFAEHDQLVPVAAARQLQQQLGDQVVIMPAAPHCLFISHPEQSWAVVKQFLAQQGLLQRRHPVAVEDSPRSLDKRQVARSFSRAAATYDSVADLQRRVGERLLACLPSSGAERVLDLGCGTGYFYAPLQRHFARARVIGLDLAQGMVAHAAHHQAGDSWLCGDAENLPLADHSIDVIFSSLAIQWCDDNQALFAEIFRVLKPGGEFVFSTLGPDTLHELRRAWGAVDDYVHVNRFAGQSVLAQAARRAGFERHSGGPIAWCEQTITLEYSTLKTLTRELKSLGAHNINSGRPTGLTGKRRMQQFIAAYEQQRNHRGLLPASYQAWYGVVQKSPVAAIDVLAGHNHGR